MKKVTMFLVLGFFLVAGLVLPELTFGAYQDSGGGKSRGNWIGGFFSGTGSMGSMGVSLPPMQKPEDTIKRPKGWDKGEKKGWNGENLPPGLLKKAPEEEEPILTPGGDGLVPPDLSGEPEEPVSNPANPDEPVAVIYSPHPVEPVGYIEFPHPVDPTMSPEEPIDPNEPLDYAGPVGPGEPVNEPLDYAGPVGPGEPAVEIPAAAIDFLNSLGLNAEDTGDLNADGVVNMTDMLLFAEALNKVMNNVGKTGEGIEGDLNGDGCVNMQDVLMLTTYKAVIDKNMGKEVGPSQRVIEYLQSQGLTVHCNGDLNDDGVVNMTDMLLFGEALQAVLDHVGKKGPEYAQYDLTGDGVVNMSDVLRLLTYKAVIDKNMGKVVGSQTQYDSIWPGTRLGSQSVKP